MTTKSTSISIDDYLLKDKGSSSKYTSSTLADVSFSMVLHHDCCVEARGSCNTFADNLGSFWRRFCPLNISTLAAPPCPSQHNKIKCYKLAVLFPCESLEYTHDAPSDENDKENAITHSFPFVCPCVATAHTRAVLPKSTCSQSKGFLAVFPAQPFPLVS